MRGVAEVQGSSVDPREARTMAQLVRAAAAEYGDSIAVRLALDGQETQEVSFAELDRRSSELGRGLLARGVGKGTRVGFMFGNGPGFALIFAAIARIGAIAVPLSTMLRANELVRTLRQSDISGLIVQRHLLGYDYIARLCEALPELIEANDGDLRIAKTPYLRWIVSDGDDLPIAIRGYDYLTSVADTVSEDVLVEIEREVYPTDQIIEIYTSGSMALPKGVKHLHGPILARAHYLRSMGTIQRGESHFANLPFFWVGGLMLSLMPGWEAGAIVDCSERTLSNSRVAMGSVLAPEDLKLMANAKPFWGLGMSETIGPYSYGDELRAEGYPLCAPMDHIAPTYEVRVADENDQPVPEGDVGELQVRGYALTPGLHKFERADHFTADGYYHTGDMGKYAGTRLLFVGRNGDMIKTAGSNVSPAEVEEELQAMEGVHSAYVVGLPDKERGKLVVAALVAKEGAQLDTVEIEGRLRKSLSSYKVPRAYVVIDRTEVPLLHSNKISRRILEDMMTERLGR